MNPEFPKSFDNYCFQEQIGSGVVSRVYRAICNTNQQELAIKVINLTQCHLQEIINRELQFWAQCHSQFIVEYYGSFVSMPNQYIFTPYFPYGSIETILNQNYPNGFSSEPLIAAILTDVLQALEYIHSHPSLIPVENRNWNIIRASNFMLTQSGEIKLDNFGLSTSLLQGGQKQGSTLSFFTDPCYIAPEILRNGEGLSYSNKSDIWTLGLVAFQLATGKMPYSGLSFTEGLVQIIQNPPPSLPETFTPEFRDFIRICLNKDPSERPTATDLLQSPFILTARTHAYVKSVLCVPHNYSIFPKDFHEEYPENDPKMKKSATASFAPKKQELNLEITDDHPKMSVSCSEEKMGRFKVTSTTKTKDLQSEVEALRKEVEELEKENDSLYESLDQIIAAVRNYSPSL